MAVDQTAADILRPSACSHSARSAPLADGIDYAYIAHVAIHPDHQGMRQGKAIIRKLAFFPSGQRKAVTSALTIWADTPVPIPRSLGRPFQQ